MSATYGLNVGWDNISGWPDIVSSWAEDDITTRVRVNPSIKCSRGRDQIRKLAPPMAGKFSATVSNQDKHFSIGYHGTLINMISNPAIGVDTSGWTAEAHTAISQNVGETGIPVTTSIKSITDGSVASEGFYLTTPITVSPNTDYVMSCYIKAPAGITLRLVLNDTVDLSVQNDTIVGDGTWHRYEIAITTDTHTTLRVYVLKLAISATTFYATAFQLEGGSVASAYCDGNQDDCRWAGASDASQSYRGGTLYGLLKAGKPLWLTAELDATTYSLFTGVLDDLVQHPGFGASVDLPALGLLSRLAGKSISTALYQTVRTDEALGYLLDAVGWPAGMRDIDTGLTTLDWWWLYQEDGLAALKAILGAEGPGASIYEDGSGYLHFEARDYRVVTARCTTSQALFSDVAEPSYYRPMFVYNPGLKSVINQANVKTNTRTKAGAVSVVWTYGNVTLTNNEVRKLQVTATVPFANALVPVAATDYVLTAGAVTPTLDRLSGQSCTLTLTAGAAGATMTGLQLRAKVVSLTSETEIRNSIDASASITAYGLQALDWPCRPEIPPLMALDMANAVVNEYQDPKTVLAITLRSDSGDRLLQSLTRELSDRVTVVNEQTGLGEQCFIERIEHEVIAGSVHQTTLGLESIVAADWAIWGTGKWDESCWGW